MFKFNSSFFSIGYLPRWIILCIDIAILVFANILTHAILVSLTLGFYNALSLAQQYGLIFLVNFVFLLFFKIYAGVVRHSSIVDAVKIFFATFASYLVLITINYSNFILLKHKIFLFPQLLISFILTFSFLFIFRVIVKYFFENYIYKSSNEFLISAIVYGTDANAIAVVNAVNAENPARFKIVSFIQKSKNNSSKRILGLPILNYNEKISDEILKQSAKALIIADKNISKDEQLNIIDDCLENDIKVLSAPVIGNFEDENQISNKIKNFEILDLLDRKPIVLNNNNLIKQLTNKVVLITGAAGSIGSEIVRQALTFYPEKLIILDQAESPLHELSLEILKVSKNTKIETIICDVRNVKSLRSVFEKYNPNIVFHAAAYKHVPLMENNPREAINTNVIGTKNLADLSLEFQVKKFVLVSTDKAVNPSNVMGASKRIAEKYVQSLFFENLEKHEKEIDKKVTKFITTRFGNVLGSNGSVVPLFTKQINEGGPITITHPDIIRYFMTIPEACQLVLEAGVMGNGGEIYIFDMGKPVKIIDLAKKMIRLAGFEPDKDIKIKIVGLRPGEKLYEELLNDGSKTLETHHNKIMIAEEKKEDAKKVLTEIEILINTMATLTNNEIVAQMKAIVPEFISMNSNYEKLDK